MRSIRGFRGYGLDNLVLYIVNSLFNIHFAENIGTRVDDSSNRIHIFTAGSCNLII